MVVSGVPKVSLHLLLEEDIVDDGRHEELVDHRGNQEEYKHTHRPDVPRTGMEQFSNTFALLIIWHFLYYC